MSSSFFGVRSSHCDYPIRKIVKLTALLVTFYWRGFAVHFRPWSLGLILVSALNAQTIAYDAPLQPGNQGWYGNLGLDFDVNRPIVVRSLGVFDSNGDGFVGTAHVAIFNRSSQTAVTPTATFTGTAGTLINSDRFQTLISPVVLLPGSYTVVAVGFSASDPNGNSGCVSNFAGTCLGNNPFSPSTENGGGGSISFVGIGRYDYSGSLDYPTVVPPPGPSNWTGGGDS